MKNSPEKGHHMASSSRPSRTWTSSKADKNVGHSQTIGFYLFRSQMCSKLKFVPKLRCLACFDFEMCFAPQRLQLCISHLARWLRSCHFSKPTFRPPPEPQIIGNTQRFASFLSFSTPGSPFIQLSLFSYSFFFFSLLCFSLPLPISGFHLSILWEGWLLDFFRSYDCIINYHQQYQHVIKISSAISTIVTSGSNPDVQMFFCLEAIVFIGSIQVSVHPTVEGLLILNGVWFWVPSATPF